MADVERDRNLTAVRKKSRMPANSVFYEKIVPMLLIALGVIMLGLMVLAAGVLLGLIHF